MSGFKNRLLNIIRGFAAFAAVSGYIVLNVVFIIVCLPILIVPSKRFRSAAISFLLNQFLRFICFVFLPALGVYKIADIKGFETSGAEPRIYVSNHASLLDSLLLLALIPNCGIVVKSKYSSWLVVGFLIKFFDFVSVDPSKAGNIGKVLEKSRKVIASGKSIVIFPEGQRSPSRRVMDFHKLAFKLSFESRITIVPAVVYCTKPILAKGGDGLLSNMGGKFYIEFMPCEYPAEYKNADMLSHAAFQKISKRVVELNALHNKKTEKR